MPEQLRSRRHQTVIFDVAGGRSQPQDLPAYPYGESPKRPEVLEMRERAWTEETSRSPQIFTIMENARHRGAVPHRPHHQSDDRLRRRLYIMDDGYAIIAGVSLVDREHLHDEDLHRQHRQQPAGREPVLCPPVYVGDLGTGLLQHGGSVMEHPLPGRAAQVGQSSQHLDTARRLRARSGCRWPTEPGATQIARAILGAPGNRRGSSRRLRERLADRLVQSRHRARVNTGTSR